MQKVHHLLHYTHAFNIQMQSKHEIMNERFHKILFYII